MRTPFGTDPMGNEDAVQEVARFTRLPPHRRSSLVNYFRPPLFDEDILDADDFRDRATMIYLYRCVVALCALVSDCIKGEFHYLKPNNVRGDFRLSDLKVDVKTAEAAREAAAIVLRSADLPVFASQWSALGLSARRIEEVRERHKDEIAGLHRTLADQVKALHKGNEG